MTYEERCFCDYLIDYYSSIYTTALMLRKV